MFVWEARHSDVSRVHVCRHEVAGVVAYCASWLVFEELHINMVAVAPGWRRQGVARRLLEHVLREARTQGAQAATLEVRRANVAARQLYESLGFEHRGVRVGYYRTPPDDALILWRDLGDLRTDALKEPEAEW
jgi:ribosomal-protein-alanine acetyltransferase